MGGSSTKQMCYTQFLCESTGWLVPFPVGGVIWNPTSIVSQDNAGNFEEFQRLTIGLTAPFFWPLRKPLFCKENDRWETKVKRYHDCLSRLHPLSSKAHPAVFDCFTQESWESKRGPWDWLHFIESIGVSTHVSAPDAKANLMEMVCVTAGAVHRKMQLWKRWPEKSDFLDVSVALWEPPFKLFSIDFYRFLVWIQAKCMMYICDVSYIYIYIMCIIYIMHNVYTYLHTYTHLNLHVHNILL